MHSGALLGLIIGAEVRLWIKLEVLLLASMVNLLNLAAALFLLVALFSWLNLAQVNVELVSGADSDWQSAGGEREFEAAIVSLNCLMALGLNSLSSGWSNNFVLADDDLPPKTTIFGRYSSSCGSLLKIRTFYRKYLVLA